MDKNEIRIEALHLIESLDNTAYEQYAAGEITPEKYQLMAQKITNFQRITENILCTVL